MDKIDIIGDAYVAVSQSADDAVAFCLACLAVARTTFWDGKDPRLGTIHLRCAVHTGKVTGLVLDAVPFKYTLVGETAVRAKHMETETPPGHVNCSATTAKHLDATRFHLVCHEGHPECYLVYRAEYIKNTVLTAKGLRFVSVSDEFLRMFGFEVADLQSMRPLFGPLTRLDAIHMAIDLCTQFNHPVNIPTTLYTRAAETVSTSIEFRKSDEDDDHIVIRCTLLSRPADESDTSKA